MMKVSFDFDGCLVDNKWVQMICKLFKSSGHDIFIITSRDPKLPNLDLWKLAQDFQISSENIHLTNGSLKVHTFMELGIDIHFDNSFDEVVAINDMFEDEHKPAILTNFNSEEMGYIYNYIKKL